MSDNNGDTSIATLHNVLLESYLCDRLFYIIALMNLVNNSLFHKGFFMVYFGDIEKNVVTLQHSVQQKHAFLVENNVKTKKIAPRKKIALECFH